MGRLNKYQKFVKEKLERNNYIKLVNVQKLSDFKSHFLKPLQYIYNSDTAYVKHAGSILNAAYYHKINIFLLSFHIVNKLVEKDPNNTLKGTNPREYKDIMHKLLQNEVIKVVRSQQGKRAGLYELTGIWLEPLIKEVGKRKLNEIRKEHIDWYDNSTNKKQKLPPGWDEAQRRVNERNNKRK